ncbi:Hypothetical protein HVR_LOCUS206 [uncultured virus]|nr:Hypothetical protein HVR_LOCUS206 [uncultured virus]
MGNKNTTPHSHAKSAVLSFIEGLKENEPKNANDNVDGFSAFMKQKFAVYLEDHIANDGEFDEFNDKGKTKSLGIMLFMFATLPLDNITKSERKAKYIDVVSAKFEKRVSPSEFLSSYLKTNYAYDGADWYSWDDKSSWVKTSDISLGDYVTKLCLNVEVSNLGLNSDLITAAVVSMNEYLASIKKEAETFIESDAYKKTIELMKSNPAPFNQKSNIIPCHSLAIYADECNGQGYESSDYFITKLNYDMDQSESRVVEKYLKHLNTDKNNLADFLVRCGCGVSKTLTVVSGPAKSGKSTLLKVARAMYGPYASTSDEFVLGNKVVRVCFLNDRAFKDHEDDLKKHECDHLVVVSDSKFDGESFAGRSVRNLVFTETIKEEDHKENIFSNLNTRKQFGHLLGWAMKKYDSSLFRNSSADPVKELMSGKGCGNSNCKNCGPKSELGSLLSLLGGIP